MSPALQQRLFGAEDRGGGRDSGLSGRGKKKQEEGPLSPADFEGVDAEKLSPQKQEVRLWARHGAVGQAIGCG